MTAIDVVVRRSLASRRSQAEVYADVADVPSVARSIPAVKRCERRGERWRWELSRYGALGLEVVPAFDVDATFTPPTDVHFRPVGEVSEDARGRGHLQIEERPGGSRISVTVHLLVDVPIGAFLAPALKRIMAREIGKVLDDMLLELA